jgi:hypothetical protein
MRIVQGAFSGAFGCGRGIPVRAAPRAEVDPTGAFDSVLQHILLRCTFGEWLKHPKNMVNSQVLSVEGSFLWLIILRVDVPRK